MNKITSTLTGLALVAAASVAPAFAQGNLFTPAAGSPFTITGIGTANFSISGTASFNASNSSTVSTAAFTLTGSDLSGPLYTIKTFSFTPAGGALVTEPAGSFFTVVGLPSGATSVASVGSLPDGSTFNLISAPVPEASTVVSFGALLALGGMAVVLRRKSVKNAA